MNDYINQNGQRYTLFLSPASLALGQGSTILQGGKESQQPISTANFNDLLKRNIGPEFGNIEYCTDF